MILLLNRSEYDLTNIYSLIKGKKNKQYYNLLNQWIAIKHRGLSLEQYFLKHEINNIAIYGMGEIGCRLYEELINTNLTINYAIDSNANAFHNSIKVVHLDEVLEPVDAIIVTTLSFFEQVQAELKEKIGYRIISLNSIIREVQSEIQ